MSFDVNWDIEKYRDEHESDDHWLLRRNFMERWKPSYPEERLVCLARVFANIEFMGCRYPSEVMQEVARMSKEVNKNLTLKSDFDVNLPCTFDGRSLAQNSANAGVSCVRYSWDELIGDYVVKPTYSNDLVTLKQNSAAVGASMKNYPRNSALGNSEWSINPREAIRGPVTPCKPVNSSVNESEYVWGHYSSEVMRGPVSISKVLKTTYKSFVCEKTLNQNIASDDNSTWRRYPKNDTQGSPSLSSAKKQTLSQNFGQEKLPDENLAGGISLLWRRRDPKEVVQSPFGINKSIKPYSNTATNSEMLCNEMSKGTSPVEDCYLVLYPKEKTYSVKMKGERRIVKEVIKIIYCKSLNSKIYIYTVGRHGVCRKQLSESNKEHIFWWMDQGKTIEEALMLCLRPYHEIYEELLKGKHSSGTPISVKNLLEQMKKTCKYKIDSDKTQVEDSTSTDDSDIDNIEVSQQDGNQSMKWQASQNMLHTDRKLTYVNSHLNLENAHVYDANSNIHEPKKHLSQYVISSDLELIPQQEESEPTTVTEKPNSGYSYNLQNYEAFMPVEDRFSEHYKPIVHESTDCTYQEARTNKNISSNMDIAQSSQGSFGDVEKIVTGEPMSYIKLSSSAKKRYRWWTRAGKSPEEAKVLCLKQMCEIPEYEQIKQKMGTFKHFLKPAKNVNKLSKSFCNAALGITHPAFNINGTLSMPIKDSAKNRFQYWIGLGKAKEEARWLSKRPIRDITLAQQLQARSMESKRLRKLAKIEKRKQLIMKKSPPSQYLKINTISTSQPAKENAPNKDTLIIEVSENDKKDKILSTQDCIELSEDNSKKNEERKSLTKKKHIRRLKWWIRQGKSEGEAYILCQMPMDKIPEYKEIMYKNRREKNLAYKAKKQKELEKFQRLASRLPSLHTLQKRNATNKKTDIIEVSDDDEKDNILSTQDRIELSKDNSRKNEERTRLVKKKHRRRLKWWIQQGKSEGEAYILCQIPMDKIPEYKEIMDRKRREKNLAYKAREFQSHTSPIPTLPTLQGNTSQKSSEQNLSSKHSTQTGNTNKLKFCENAAGINQNVQLKVCIKDDNKQICQEEYVALQNAIAQCFSDNEEISIIRCVRKSGCVIVTCANEQSRDWLDKEIPSLAPWEGAQLTIINEDEIPTPIYAWVYIPIVPESGMLLGLEPDGLLEKLHKQNPNVGCDKWTVLNTQIQKDGQLLMVRFDDKSNDVLQSQGHKLNWYSSRPIRVKLKSRNQSNKVVAKDLPNHGNVESVPSITIREESYMPPVKNRAHRSPYNVATGTAMPMTASRLVIHNEEALTPIEISRHGRILPTEYWIDSGQTIPSHPSPLLAGNEQMASNLISATYEPQVQNCAVAFISNPLGLSHQPGTSSAMGYEETRVSSHFGVTRPYLEDRAYKQELRVRTIVEQETDSHLLREHWPDTGREINYSHQTEDRLGSGWDTDTSRLVQKHRATTRHVMDYTLEELEAVRAPNYSHQTDYGAGPRCATGSSRVKGSGGSEWKIDSGKDYT